METKLWILAVVAFCALLGSFGQYFFKLGSSSVSFSIISWVTNWKVIFGLSLYAVAVVLQIFALKYGNLSIIYPIIATSYIWTMFISVFLLGEAVSLANWLGVIAIVIGITLIVI